MDNIANIIKDRREQMRSNILKGFAPEEESAVVEEPKVEKTETCKSTLDLDIFKAREKRAVGTIHPNGKWVWTEYKPGKYDWKSLKGWKHGKKQDDKTSNSGSQTNSSPNTQTTAKTAPQAPSNGGSKGGITWTKDDFKNRNAYQQKIRDDLDMAVGGSTADIGKPRSWVSLNGEDYVKLGDNKWQKQSNNPHVLSPVMSTDDFEVLLHNSRNVDMSRIVKPANGGQTKPAQPTSQKPKKEGDEYPDWLKDKMKGVGGMFAQQSQKSFNALYTDAYKELKDKTQQELQTISDKLKRGGKNIRSQYDRAVRDKASTIKINKLGRELNRIGARAFVVRNLLGQSDNSVKNSLDISSIDNLNQALSEYGFVETGKSKNQRKQGSGIVELNGAWDKDGRTYELSYSIDKDGKPYQNITATITRKSRDVRIADKKETVSLDKLGDRLNEIFADTVEHNKGKLSNKISNIENYFTEQGGFKVQKVFEDLFPDLKGSKWTQADLESKGYNYGEMGKLVSALRNVGHAVFGAVNVPHSDISNQIPSQLINDEDDEVRIFKTVNKQYQDTVAQNMNKSKDELIKLHDEAVRKREELKDNWNNNKTDQAALKLAKARVVAMALQNVEYGKAAAKKELEKINLNDYKVKG